MHLTALSSFLALVTPERLEEYLREKGWNEKSANDRFAIWTHVALRRQILVVQDQELGDYLQRTAEAATDLAKAYGLEPTAVLYDLLPPEHRQELVKAVFPGLEEGLPLSSDECLSLLRLLGAIGGAAAAFRDDGQRVLVELAIEPADRKTARDIADRLARGEGRKP